MRATFMTSIWKGNKRIGIIVHEQINNTCGINYKKMRAKGLHHVTTYVKQSELNRVLSLLTGEFASIYK